MNNSRFPFPIALLAVTAALLTGASPVVRAQDASVTIQPAPPISDVPAQTQTTVTTTTVPAPPIVVPTQTQTTQTTTTATVPVQQTVQSVAPVTLQPGQHLAEIEVVLTHGTAQAYFGHAPRGEKLGIGSAEIRIKLPSTATVTKLASRDKESDGATRITADNPWHVTVPFNGSGRYVFNLVEWDDDATAAIVLVKVDGAVIFEGRGHSDDISNWPQKTFGQGVRKTGSREIAFDVE